MSTDQQGLDFDSVEVAIAAIARGDVVIVVDDEDREDEGDFVMAAELATPERLAFFVRYGSGVVCVALTEARCDELRLPLMVEHNTEAQRTAFTASVDLKVGTTTGISAADRSRTIRALADPACEPSDLARPGHVFPLRSRPGGVLRRAGHTEAAVDLAQLAGLTPAGVICEAVNDDGTMARRQDLKVFAQEHGLSMISIADLIRYRKRTESHVRRTATARIPTRFGAFTAVSYESKLDQETHIAFVRGDVFGAEDVLVRVHSECLTGDILGSLRCDCGPQLQGAMELIANEGRGVVVYLRGHEGRGIGITNKLRAYELQDRGLDTVDANTELGLDIDRREYGVGASILSDLGITTMRLLSNNPRKVGGLQGYGLTVVDRVPLQVSANPENIRYLRTKRDRMGHMFEGLESVVEGS
jgi:3,4-dihydroxy 2-butanone 4-phosphate synthase/GTP cyclohydrolase II